MGRIDNVVILEIKIKDETNKTIYKAKVFNNNLRYLSTVLTSLEEMGVPITSAIGLALEEKKSFKEEKWF